MSFSQEPFEDQDQQPEDNEPEIKYTQLDGHPEARPPFFTESSYAVGPYTSRPAWFMPHELGDPFVGIGRYSDNFEARYNSFSFGIHPHPYSKSLFSSLEMNENMPFADCRVINDLETLFYSSRTYYPWSGYDAGPRGELPAALNEYQSFVAELKRTVLPIPRSSSPSVGANEQLMNDLRAEHSRFMCELSVLRELKGPLLRLVEATRLEYWDGPDELRVLAVEENDRLKVYRRMLLQWLREVEDEMNEGLDMYQLSLEEDDEQYRPQESSEKQCHWHHRLHCDQDLSQSQFARHMETEEEKKVVREAKAQLQEYNRRWAEILSRPPSTSHCTSTALAQPISIPYPYISKSSPSPEIPETTSISQAWASHTFFRHAFNLSPYLEPPPANLPLSPPQFAFSTSGSPERQMRDLMGLRNQLKMEKVRWHEDRLKAVFGAEAAREERAKGVWGVVIDLKRGVDEALELLESG
ncbi:hypothetical protein BKA65DRAFT_488699 [Rhexocercosporidium sp. MPI-PUGE-AT-0058]|nr:hypothetical protein BKA65DRAFT_488699 [Rhexocercosporidium sp. MPI-PUGE-AT-0058]